MKFLIAVLAFVASALAIQDSLIPTDLEVSPSGMSKTCADIFAPLQSEDVNNRREECKKQYPDNKSPEDVACKIRCILINTGFITRDDGKPVIKLFKQGVQSVYKGNEEMVDRIVSAFEFCYNQAKLIPDIDPKTCANPGYTRYGLCLYEMARKLCQNVLNVNSNPHDKWGEKKNFVLEKIEGPYENPSPEVLEMITD